MLHEESSREIKFKFFYNTASPLGQLRALSPYSPTDLFSWHHLDFSSKYSATLHLLHC